VYQIVQMKKEDIPQAMTIWHRQFAKYCGDGSFPDFWDGGHKEMESYLLKQLEKGNAIVAKKNEAIAGFMAWMNIDFHGEKSAFCPTISHAAIEGDKEQVYRAIYNYVSQKWVENNMFNHLWMIFHDDSTLKNILYVIGFGSYVIDACQKTSEIAFQIDCPHRISKAIPSDADLLFNLVEESRHYYLNAPIFLKRDIYTKEALSNVIDESNVFIAWDNSVPIGVMSLTMSKRYNIETLAGVRSGLIKDLGAYIKPEYRGKGIGTRLLKEVFDHCKNASIPYVHLSYETANPFANRFWRKYFKLIILSVRRTVNKDANSLGSV
jgi:GNAT superfamily N-acetyltransferase